MKMVEIILNRKYEVKNTIPGRGTGEVRKLSEQEVNEIR